MPTEVPGVEIDARVHRYHFLNGIRVSGGIENIDVSTGAITAGTTQTQEGATLLTHSLNRITVSANAGDGVKLPPAERVGKTVEIKNAGASAAKVWPSTGDKINGGSANAADSTNIAAAGYRKYVVTSYDAENEVGNWDAY